MKIKYISEILEKIRYREYLTHIIITNRMQIRQAEATMVTGREFWLYEYINEKELEIKETVEDLQDHRKNFITYLENLC